MKTSLLITAVFALHRSSRFLVGASSSSVRDLEDPTVIDDDVIADHYQMDDAVGDEDMNYDDAIIHLEEHLAGDNAQEGPSTIGTRFSLWPPPPSTFFQTDCYLHVNSCVHHEDVHRNDSVAMTLVCKDISAEPLMAKEPLSYVLNRTDLLRLAVEHQRNMANDFCQMCREDCEYNANSNSNNYYNSNYNNYNNNQYNANYYSRESTYVFVPQEMQLSSSLPQEELPFFYQCEACLEECHLRDTTSANVLVETAIEYSNCGPIQQDDGSNASIVYAGPVCQNMEEVMHLSSLQMDFGIYQDATCLALRDSPLAEGRSSGKDLLHQYSSFDIATEPFFSNAMWDSILTAPLSCVPTTLSGDATTVVNGVPQRLGWCQSVLDLADPCQLEWDDETNRPLCGHAQRTTANLPQPQNVQLPRDLPIIYYSTTTPHDPPYYDLSGATLRYGRCHSQEEEESKTLSFVSFEMCLGGATKCPNACQDYVVDLETYLKRTGRHHQDAQRSACRACSLCEENLDGPPFVATACDYCMLHGHDIMTERDSYCWARSDIGANAFGDSVDCDTCYEFCSKIENMEANGYLDATVFSICQMIYDPEDDGLSSLFAGPICLDDRVKIGVFLDEECLQYDPNKDVEDYLMDDEGYQMKLSYAMLKSITTYASDTPLTCAANTPLSDNPNPVWEENQMCGGLRLDSLSCLNGTFNEDTIMIPEANATLFQSFCPTNETAEMEEEEAGAQPSGEFEAAQSEEGPSSAADAYHDLTGASLQFGQCHDATDLLADIAQEASIAITTASAAAEHPKHYSSNEGYFISFVMCTGGPSTDSTCSEEQDCQVYVTDIETYLIYTLQHYAETMVLGCDTCTVQCGVDWKNESRPDVENPSSFPFVEKACNFCSLQQQQSSRTQGDDEILDSYCWSRNEVGDYYDARVGSGTVDCHSCPTECYMIWHAETNGYVQATEFRTCVRIYSPDEYHTEKSDLFAGPVCSGDGSKVKIGVFRADNCLDLDPNREVDDFLKDAEGYQMKVSYMMMKAVAYAGHKPLPCAADTPLSSSGVAGAVTLNHMCQGLKDVAYSCRNGSFGPNVVDAMDHFAAGNAALYQSFCPDQEEPSSPPSPAEKENPTLVEEGGLHETVSAALGATWLSYVAVMACVLASWLALV